jgi:hypothetical protein
VKVWHWLLIGTGAAGLTGGVVWFTLRRRGPSRLSTQATGSANELAQSVQEKRKVDQSLADIGIVAAGNRMFTRGVNAAGQMFGAGWAAANTSAFTGGAGAQQAETRLADAKAVVEQQVNTAVQTGMQATATLYQQMQQHGLVPDSKSGGFGGFGF